MAGRALLTLNDPEVIPHGQMTPQMGRVIEDMLPTAPKPTGKDDTPLDNHTPSKAEAKVLDTEPALCPSPAPYPLLVTPWFCQVRALVNRQGGLRNSA